MALLDELYEHSFKKLPLIARKLTLEDTSTLIHCAPASGATSLLQHHLQQYKSSSYLYIDANDLRVSIDEINATLDGFCALHSIGMVAIDNYTRAIKLPDVDIIYLCTHENMALENFVHLRLLPLDFEEFMALDSRYDTPQSALSHYLQTGGFAHMTHTSQAHRTAMMQMLLRTHYDELERAILKFVAHHLGQKVSVFQIFERLKSSMKLSKDTFYKTFYNLTSSLTLLWLEKYSHPKATKKIYFVDFAMKNALSFQKNFAKLFENMIFLQLVKAQRACFYDEGIDFFIPDESRAVMAMPFANEAMMFTLIEKIQDQLFTHQIKHVDIITMSNESSMNHPFAEVQMLSFTRWALME